MPFVGLLERLHQWVQEQPNKKAWTFLNDKGDPIDSYTYQELEAATNHLANFLGSPSSGLKKGDRALLVFFPGLDFSAALLACFKAEIIAVPVFPPDPRKLKKDLHHFVSIQSSSGAKVALTNAQFNFVKKVEDIKNIFTSVKWPELQWIQIEEYLKKGKGKISNMGTTGVPSFPSMEKIAFLQYTSGSTSEPKGVMISHQNLGHNLHLIINELRANQSTINVAWLPQYHDMGLIGSYLGVLYCGGSGYYLSPISFLKDPLVWIKALSQFKGTHTQAPNFAYALVARKFHDRHGPNCEYDLSSVQHMINAAEPVDYEAIMNFYDIFTQFGLPPNVVIPTYGLAEHTVFVCSGGLQALTVSKAALEKGLIEIINEEELIFEKSKLTPEINAEEHHKIVGCGFPFRGEDVKVVIVNSESGTELPPLVVGEVWVNSPSKAFGYWGKPELSKHDFSATIQSSSTAESEQKVDTNGEFLRTGDLGFLYKGELFICGRIKDLIIIGGSNHYPQDIEHSIEQQAVNYLRAGCSAAFSLRSEANHTEDIAYVAEIKDGVSPDKYEEIVALCRQCASNEHGVGLAIVCLLQTRSVPKTTSGKIARSWCKRGLLEGTLQIVYRSEKVISNDIEVQDSESTKPSEIVTSNSDQAVKSDGNNPRPVEVNQPHQSAEEIRNLSLQEISAKLEKVLIQISSVGPTQLNSPIDKKLPLVAMGLDSMTVVQFKGVIENRFHCDIPDEFIFSSLATLEELSVSVKKGALTDDQKQRFETAHHSAQSAEGKNPDDEGKTTTIPANYRQPICPWFTCCY